MLILPYQIGDAYENMALDQWMLEHCMGFGQSMFRHYGWCQKAYTFGYSQRYQNVLKEVENGVVICRRPTGGGIVEHGEDWTYALAIPASHQLFSKRSIKIYFLVHTLLAKCLKLQGLAVVLQQESLKNVCPKNVNKCFERAEVYDLVNAEKKKLAGAALRRTRQGLLIQGSINQALLPSCNWTVFAQDLKASLSLFF